jgi:hypothetical protein
VAEIVHEPPPVPRTAAAEWLARLAPAGEDEVAAYRAAVPFPLEAARAKGRRFSVEARRAAGLSEALIEYVRSARPAPGEGLRKTDSRA